jgi:hypothetical protein
LQPFLTEAKFVKCRQRPVIEVVGLREELLIADIGHAVVVELKELPVVALLRIEIVLLGDVG